MLLKLATVLLGMTLVSAAPEGERSRVISRSDDGKITMSKPSGDTEVEIMEVDHGDYSLLYYLQPDWKAGSVEGKDGRRVPVKLKLLFVVRIDKVSGAIELLDDQLGGVAASGDPSCATNGCYGVCCAFQTDTEMCIICTCCDQGGGNCQGSGFVCRKIETK